MKRKDLRRNEMRLLPWPAATAGAFLSLALLAVLLWMQPVVAGDVPEPAPTLTLIDCDKCHSGVTAAISKNGGAHGSKVTCLDCHRSHPPAGFNVIPECRQCHTGREHFVGENCLHCHQNPHAPLELQLSRDITGPCLTCHPEPGRQLRAVPSFHSRLACTACHNRHGHIPECLRCHAVHAEGQNNASCKICHPAHAPLEIGYGQSMVSEQCGACHLRPFALLAGSAARHRMIACAECHPDRHGKIPACSDCHNMPHPQVMLDKYPECGQCHGKAHDLVPVSSDARRSRAER